MKRKKALMMILAGIVLAVLNHACSPRDTKDAQEEEVVLYAQIQHDTDSSVEAETRAPIYKWNHTDVCFFVRDAGRTYEKAKKATISMYGHVYFRPKLLYKFDKSNMFVKGTHPYSGIIDLESNPQTMTYELTGHEDVMISNEKTIGNIDNKIAGVVIFRHLLTQLRFKLINNPLDSPYLPEHTIKEVSVVATDDSDPLNNKLVLNLTMDMPESLSEALPAGLVTFLPGESNVITSYKDDVGKSIALGTHQDYFPAVMFEPGKNVNIYVKYGSDSEKTATLSFIPEVSKAYEITLKFSGPGLTLTATYTDWVRIQQNEIQGY